MKYFLFSLISLSALLLKLQAQTLQGTVKGRVVEAVTGLPLPGAAVVVLESEPQLGGVADEAGYFKIERIPSGRVSLEVRFMGFESLTFKNLWLSPAKDLVLQVEMKER